MTGDDLKYFGIDSSGVGEHGRLRGFHFGLPQDDTWLQSGCPGQDFILIGRIQFSTNRDGIIWVQICGRQ